MHGRTSSLLIACCFAAPSVATAGQGLRGWEFNAGFQQIVLEKGQWGVDGGPAVELGVGYRWAGVGTVRLITTMARGAIPVTNNNLLGAPLVSADRRYFSMPQVNAEALLQPPKWLGIVDPSVGVRLGWTDYGPGGLNVGTRLGLRVRVAYQLAVEGGWLGDVVRLPYREHQSPWTSRRSVYVTVVTGGRVP